MPCFASSKRSDLLLGSEANASYEAKEPQRRSDLLPGYAESAQPPGHGSVRAPSAPLTTATHTHERLACLQRRPQTRRRLTRSVSVPSAQLHGFSLAHGRLARHGPARAFASAAFFSSGTGFVSVCLADYNRQRSPTVSLASFVSVGRIFLAAPARPTPTHAGSAGVSVAVPGRDLVCPRQCGDVSGSVGTCPSESGRGRQEGGAWAPTATRAASRPCPAPLAHPPFNPPPTTAARTPPSARVRVRGAGAGGQSRTRSRMAMMAMVARLVMTGSSPTRFTNTLTAWCRCCPPPHPIAPRLSFSPCPPPPSCPHHPPCRIRSAPLRSAPSSPQVRGPRGPGCRDPDAPAIGHVLAPT